MFVICGKSRKNSRKPSVILYWRSDVGIMRPSFISIQESCKYPGFLVDLCSAYRITDIAPDWQCTGGKSYQISGTIPEATASNTCLASLFAAAPILSTVEKSPLKIASMVCSDVGFIIFFIISYPPFNFKNRRESRLKLLFINQDHIFISSAKSAPGLLDFNCLNISKAFFLSFPAYFIHFVCSS